MSSNNIDFVTYCIGNLSRRLNLSAVEVYLRLQKSKVLLMRKFGLQNDIEERLDSFIKIRQAA